MKKNNHLFSIREAAKACGIGRTTLQRMTDEGLVPPAFIGENKYHFYDARSIYDINMVEFMSECGFTRKELQTMGMSAESKAEFADKLQDKINILTFSMENLRAASFTDTNVKIINIPSLTCCIGESDLPKSIREATLLVEDLLTETVRAGYHTNRYYPPFFIMKCEEYSLEYLTRHEFRSVCCIPVFPKSRDSKAVVIDSISALSITFPYDGQGVSEYVNLMYEEVNRRGVAPSDYPRVEALFNPFAYNAENRESIALRLSIPL